MAVTSLLSLRPSKLLVVIQGQLTSPSSEMWTKSEGSKEGKEGKRPTNRRGWSEKRRLQRTDFAKRKLQKHQLQQHKASGAAANGAARVATLDYSSSGIRGQNCSASLCFGNQFYIQIERKAKREEEEGAVEEEEREVGGRGGRRERGGRKWKERAMNYEILAQRGTETKGRKLWEDWGEIVGEKEWRRIDIFNVIEGSLVKYQRLIQKFT